MMSQPTIWGRVLALAAIVMCTAFALSASGDAKSGNVFAIVDFQKISTGYKAKESVESDLRNMQVKFDGQLSRRDTMPFLTEDEHKSLDAINDKATKSEADNSKIKELENRNKTKSEEIQALRQKKDADLTPADRDKMKAADAQFMEAQKRFVQLKEDLTNQLSQLGKSKSEDLMTKIRGSIAKVAKQEGVAIVFNSEFALYAGTDITEQVVSDLNKK
jgi:Skp family chaperone for outer membrane proteins